MVQCRVHNESVFVLACQTHPVWVVQSAYAFHVSTWSILFSLVIGVADQAGNGRVPV